MNYINKDPRFNFSVQTRDLALLDQLATFRLLTIRQIHKLFFDGSNISTVYRRTAKLRHAGIIEKIRLPPYFAEQNQDYYILAKAGAQLLREKRDTPHKKTKLAFANIFHDMVSVNFLVELIYQSRKFGLSIIRAEDDRMLWRYLSYAKRFKLGIRGIVPDASVTFGLGGDATLSFHLEVVRASVSGGNKNLVKKFKKYIEIVRSKDFQKLFYQQRIRAVLILTTSTKRIKIMQKLLSALDGGKELFWFASYKDLDMEKDILGYVWVDYNNTQKSIYAELINNGYEARSP